MKLDQWIELSNTFLKDEPPKRDNYVAYLFTNLCTVRNGTLTRKTHIEVIEAETLEALEGLILDYTERPDVRILAQGIEANNFTALPRRTRKVPSVESRLYQCGGDVER